MHVHSQRARSQVRILDRGKDFKKEGEEKFSQNYSEEKDSRWCTKKNGKRRRLAEEGGGRSRIEHAQWQKGTRDKELSTS